jgi:hypothetical protein
VVERSLLPPQEVPNPDVLGPGGMGKVRLAALLIEELPPLDESSGPPLLVAEDVDGVGEEDRWDMIELID